MITDIATNLSTSVIVAAFLGAGVLAARVLKDRQQYRLKVLELNLDHDVRVKEINKPHRDDIASLLPQILEDLPPIIRKSIEESLADLSSRNPELADPPVSLQTRELAEIVRELSHSLHTPLSQIEAATLSLSSSLMNQEDGAVLDRIRSSAEICKAFLGAFRELTSVAQAARSWTPDSIASILHSAVQVYSSKVGYSATLQVICRIVLRATLKRFARSGDMVGGCPGSMAG